MRSDLRKHPHAASAAEAAWPDRADPAAAEAGVTALYQAHALGLMRLAHIMLGALGEAALMIADSDDPAATRREVEGPLLGLLNGLRP